MLIITNVNVRVKKNATRNQILKMEEDKKNFIFKLRNTRVCGTGEQNGV